MDALYVAFLVLCLVALGSCSSHQAKLEQRVESKAEVEPAVAPGPELNRLTKELLEQANLRPTQKRRLEDLQARSSQEMAQLRGEIGKHQLVLVRSLVNPKVGDDEIKVTRQKIMDLEKERMDLWARNLDEAKRILGRRTEGDEKLYRAFVISEPAAADPSIRDSIGN